VASGEIFDAEEDGRLADAVEGRDGIAGGEDAAVAGLVEHDHEVGAAGSFVDFRLLDREDTDVMGGEDAGDGGDDAGSVIDVEPEVVS